MSANTLQANLLKNPGIIPDPGNAGAINCAQQGSSICCIKTSAAETRTLAASTTVGQLLTLYMDTDCGDCVITVTGGGSGFTTVTLKDAFGTVRGVEWTDPQEVQLRNMYGESA